VPVKSLVGSALCWAKAEVGVLEEGENRGDRVRQYLASVNLLPGNPWCAAYVYWAIWRASQAFGGIHPFIRTGYCPYISSWAAEKKILHDKPVKGDVFLRYGPTKNGYRAHHCGFVIEVDDDGKRFDTVEGNTNLSGGSEGIGVFQRIRKVAPEYRFVRWADLVEEKAPSTWALHLNGVLLDRVPVLNGRSFAPLRAFGEALGYTVSWDHEAQLVRYNEEPLTLENTVINGRAYAPLRELVAEIDGSLRIDADEKEIYVKAPMVAGG
jgi:hypothetical protein